jgi:hypothetical protein
MYRPESARVNTEQSGRLGVAEMAFLPAVKGFRKFHRSDLL